MVQETTLYTGKIAGLVLGNGDSEIVMSQGFEPNVPGNDPEYWSSQGQVTNAPIGGPGGFARVTSGVWSHESFRFVQWQLGPHGGCDFVPPLGTTRDIYSWTGGEVVAAGYDTGAGFHVIVRITGTSPQAYAMYAHLAGPPTVSVGQNVTLWQRLGIMGSTGTYSTGPHLHFAVFVPVTPQHSWESHVARRWVPFMPYAGPMFRPQPLGGFPVGISLVTYAGGLVTGMSAEAHEQGIEVVGVTVDGAWKMYVSGAPDHVNEAFEDHWFVGPHGSGAADSEDLWIPSGTPMSVVNLT